MTQSLLYETLLSFAHRGAIAGLGVAFVAIGAFFWLLPRCPPLKQKLDVRDAYAGALRANGQGDKALKIDKETEYFRHRPPLYGRILAAVGLVLVLASPFALK